MTKAEDRQVLIEALELFIRVHSGELRVTTGLFECRPAFLPQARRLLVLVEDDFRGI
jgi:hypothetical protein